MTTEPHDELRARSTARGVDSIAHLDDRSQALALEHRRLHERHPCVVPDCGQRARTAFAAREYGSLAGRDWWPGDVIDMCGARRRRVPGATGGRRGQAGRVATPVTAHRWPDRGRGYSIDLPAAA